MMSKLMKLSAMIGLAVAVTCLPLAAAKAKPKPKPVPKKAPAKPSTTNKATAGTTQLKGSEPKFGETWTLGKTYPWNFTMDSAEYTVEQVKIGDRIFCPKAKEKVLVLRFTVHNPQKEEAIMRYDTFHFTVVDTKDQNWEGVGDLGADKGKEPYEYYDVNMKPAQKAKLCTAVVVPAAGVMPKLIVKGSDELVLRYDLRGKVKGLAAPFADPNDPTGMTALASVPARIGDYYPVGNFDIRLDEVSTETSGVYSDTELEEGSYWLIVKMTARNETAEKAVVRYDFMIPKLTDQDGIDVERAGSTIYTASRNVDLDVQIEPAREISFRMAFQVAADRKLKTFTIKEDEDGRSYVYDASAWGK